MKFSLVDIFSDDCGFLEKTRSQNGTGTSSRGQVNLQMKQLFFFLTVILFLEFEIIENAPTEIRY